MADMDTALKESMTIEGGLGVALVDYTSGMALGVVGGGKDLDLTVAAAGNTDVVRAKLRAMEMLGLTETRANLAMARHQLRRIEAELEV